MSRNTAQDKYDDLVLDTIKNIDVNVDKLGDEAKKFNNRLGRLESRLEKVEAKVFPTPIPTKANMGPILKDPAVLRIIFIWSLIGLAIVLFITKVDLSKFI